MCHLDSLQRFIHNDEENMRRHTYGRHDSHNSQKGLKHFWRQSADIARSMPARMARLSWPGWLLKEMVYLSEGS